MTVKYNGKPVCTSAETLLNLKNEKAKMCTIKVLNAKKVLLKAGIEPRTYLACS